MHCYCVLDKVRFVLCGASLVDESSFVYEHENSKRFVRS